MGCPTRSRSSTSTRKTWIEEPPAPDYKTRRYNNPDGTERADDDEDEDDQYAY